MNVPDAGEAIAGVAAAPKADAPAAAAAAVAAGELPVAAQLASALQQLQRQRAEAGSAERAAQAAVLSAVMRAAGGAGAGDRGRSVVPRDFMLAAGGAPLLRQRAVTSMASLVERRKGRWVSSFFAHWRAFVRDHRAAEREYQVGAPCVRDWNIACGRMGAAS